MFVSEGKDGDGNGNGRRRMVIRVKVPSLSTIGRSPKPESRDIIVIHP